MILRVSDMVAAIVNEGHPVTARSVSRRIGACRFVCDHHLRALVKAGSVRKYLRSRKEPKPPTTLYVLRTPCQNTPSSVPTPASSPSPVAPSTP